MEQLEDVEAPPHAAAADDRTRCSFNEDANDTWHSPEYSRRKEPASPDDSFKRTAKSPGNSFSRGMARIARQAAPFEADRRDRARR